MSLAERQIVKVLSLHRLCTNRTIFKSLFPMELCAPSTWERNPPKSKDVSVKLTQ